MYLIANRLHRHHGDAAPLRLLPPSPKFVPDSASPWGHRAASGPKSPGGLRGHLSCQTCWPVGPGHLCLIHSVVVASRGQARRMCDTDRGCIVGRLPFALWPSSAATSGKTWIVVHVDVRLCLPTRIYLLLRFGNNRPSIVISHPRLGAIEELGPSWDGK